MEGVEPGILYSIRPIIVVIHYTPQEEADLNYYLVKLNKGKHLTIISVLQESGVNINHLKNVGIQHVQTTHFIFVEMNLAPSSILTFS